jgi:hypothetical protein
MKSYRTLRPSRPRLIEVGGHFAPLSGLRSRAR